MTRQEAIKLLKSIVTPPDLKTAAKTKPFYNAIEKGIEALEQQKNEIILTPKEYAELLINEFKQGYSKGYREAEIDIINNSKPNTQAQPSTPKKNSMNYTRIKEIFGAGCLMHEALSMAKDIFEKIENCDESSATKCFNCINEIKEKYKEGQKNV